MIQRLHILMQRRQRRQQAMIILNELVMAGYHATDLMRMAALRATVDPDLVIDAPAQFDPQRPTLSDVLDAWQRLYGQTLPKANQPPAPVEDADLQAILL